MLMHLAIRILGIGALIVVAAVSGSRADEPSREEGISAHALPKRIAALRGTQWGLEISQAPNLQPEQQQPYLQTTDEVLKYIARQDKSVRDNGLWVVTTHPSAYSDEETRFYDEIKAVLPEKGIPLFWARGSELKNGFVRY